MCKSVSLIVLVASLFLCGCGVGWGLKDHITELVSAQGVGPQVLSCKSIGSTRAGLCRLSASAEDLAALTKGLGLTEVPSAQRANDAQLTGWESSAGKDSPAKVWTGSTIRVFKSARRAKQLLLKDGSQFEYLLLYYHPEKGEIWIQVCYAYG